MKVTVLKTSDDWTLGPALFSAAVGDVIEMDYLVAVQLEATGVVARIYQAPARVALGLTMEQQLERDRRVEEDRMQAEAEAAGVRKPSGALFQLATKGGRFNWRNLNV